MINKVILIGNVGADPTINNVNVGNGVSVKVATLRLATSEKWRDKNGNPQESTQWHNVVLWRGLAQVVEKFVKKGSKIYVEGKITYRKYTANDGTERYVTEIQAENLTLLDRKPQGGVQASQAAPEQPEYPAPDIELPPADAQPADGDPDMPF